jgi:hypothetical protein
MKDIKRLQKYLSDCQQKEKDTNGVKKEFWQREIRKTSLKIQELTK